MKYPFPAVSPRLLALVLLAAALLPARLSFAQDAPPANPPAAPGSPLLQAVASGDAAAVTALLDKGTDINAPALLGASGDEEPMTPLMLAAYLGQGEIVRLLLDRGADVNRANPAGGTPLMAAIYDHRTSVLVMEEAQVKMRKAMAQAQAGFAGMDLQGFGMPAAPRRRGPFGFLNNLLDIGGKVFMAAATGGASAVAEGLLKDQVARFIGGKVGGPLGAVLQGAAGGNLKAAFPSIVGAAAQGNPALVQGLLGRGGAGALDAERWTGLVQAASRGGGAPALAALTDLGKSTEGLSPRWAEFVKAAAAGRPDAKGMFELASKEVSGSLDAFEKGLRALGDGSKADPEAQRALVALLLERGARLDARTPEGMTPLAMACVAGRADLATLLLDKGASIDAPDSEGATPLMLAARSGRADVVRLLLARGADRTKKDTYGDTARDYAEMSQEASVTAIFE